MNFVSESEKMLLTDENFLDICRLSAPFKFSFFSDKKSWLFSRPFLLFNYFYKSYGRYSITMKAKSSFSVALTSSSLDIIHILLNDVRMLQSPQNRNFSDKTRAKALRIVNFLFEFFDCHNIFILQMLGLKNQSIGTASQKFDSFVSLDILPTDSRVGVRDEFFLHEI